jgi:Protein of unknown function (DUF5818)
MKRTWILGLAILLAAGMTMASPKGAGKTFVGNISDSMCGLKHMMPGGDKECTIECVKNGAKYVLADPASGKVYELSDQKKPAQFAGEKVKVTGTLKGKVITVTSIEAAK